MANTEQDVYSLLIPAAGDSILLPNIGVAEVVAYFGNVDKPKAGAPKWLMGYLQWRGKHVPTISMEVMVGNDAPTLTRLSRLAILNTPSPNSEVPHVAVIVTGIPRLTRVTEDMLQPIDGVTPTAKARAFMSGQTIQIPDVEKFEQMALETMAFKPDQMS